jgi:hypothetical protein
MKIETICKSDKLTPREIKSIKRQLPYTGRTVIAKKIGKHYNHVRNALKGDKGYYSQQVYDAAIELIQYYKAHKTLDGYLEQSEQLETVEA